MQREYSAVIQVKKFPMEDYQYVIEVNQNAVFDWCQRAAKKFIAQDSKGKIINIASMLSSLVVILFRLTQHRKGQ